ncbi:MAG: AraC family transcriptional regulator [Planctomycetota bacterium]
MNKPDDWDVTTGVTRINSAISNNPANPELAVVLCVDSQAKEEAKADFGFGRFGFDVRPRGAVIPIPGVPSTVTGDGPYDLLWLMLPWEGIQSRIESALDRPMPHLPAQVHRDFIYDSTIENAMSQCWSAMSQPHAGAPLVVDGLVNVILGRLLQFGETPIAAPKRRAKLSSRQYAAVVDLIEYRSPASPSLDELADAAGVTRFHFSRLFKQTAGVSPMHFVQQRKIERAQNLMRTRPEWTLAAVAFDCGFADQSHFTRTFKKHLGVSPSAWLHQI